MDFYLSNATKQNTIFNYRLEQKGQVIQQNIAYGKQVKLPHDLTKEQIDYILSQHHGVDHEYLVNVKSIDLNAGHIGLIYSIGSPVNPEKTASTIDENDGILDLQAAQLRKDTVSVIAANLGKDGNAPAELTSELIEEKPKGGDKDGLKEGIRVSDGSDRK